MDVTIKVLRVSKLPEDRHRDHKILLEVKNLSKDEADDIYDEFELVLRSMADTFEDNTPQEVH